MRAPISIIIPTLNVQSEIRETLASLIAGVTDGLICELIFADGGSDDDTIKIAKEIGATVIRAPKGRGQQLHAGASSAKGDWLFFIHADTVLSPDWIAAVKQHIGTSQKPAYARLQFNTAGFFPRLVAGWANLRSRIFHLPYGDQTLLVSKQTYADCGGFRPIPLMEDVEIARALSPKPIALACYAITSATRYEKEGWVRRGWRNLTTLALYFAGVSPQKLAQRYNS